jgi:hypothetical protein
MHMCQDEGCKCANIANYLDELKMMRQAMDQEFLKGTRYYNSNNHLNRSIGTSLRGYAKTIGQEGSKNETQIDNNKDQDNGDSLIIEENSFHMIDNSATVIDDIKTNSRQNIDTLLVSQLSKQKSEKRSNLVKNKFI